MVKAVVGVNWGDEGKGKIVDMLSEQADVVVRFQGGCNAGHTIVNDYGKFALHTLPSGVFHQNITNICGNGMALDIDKLMEELRDLKSRGVPEPKLMVSDRVQVMMPYHRLIDSLEEARLAGKAYGSTQSGIAPFYSDKFAKIGWQINEFFMSDGSIKEKIEKVCDIKDVMLTKLYGEEKIDRQALFDNIMRQREMIAPYIGKTEEFLHRACKDGRTILLESQLGTLKDIDFGIYPMVTSSNPLAGYGSVGAGGIAPYEIKQVIAVTKAYSSAVGGGDFVSEIFGSEAETLRRNGGDGGEYGATTGRPRRVGWYDCVASRYGCMMQGATDVAFTVMDDLGYLDRIPVCVAYEKNGERTTEFPVYHELSQCKPVYEYLPGWKCDIRGITEFGDLPAKAQDYVNFIEEHLGFPITLVGNGPSRKDIIHRESKLSAG